MFEIELRMKYKDGKTEVKSVINGDVTPEIMSYAILSGIKHLTHIWDKYYVKLSVEEK